MEKRNIAIFASGEGTNAQSIMDHFRDSDVARIALVVSNRPDANVLNRAKRQGIRTLLIDRSSFYESDQVIHSLQAEKIDLIVLAGFLWMMPEKLIRAFPGKIINIHPALLPKFGGKGMYGMNVHRAVIAAKEKESGISIHYVNEHYDEGKLIAQFKCSVSENDTAEMIAEKVQKLEHEHFASAIEKVLSEYC